MVNSVKLNDRGQRFVDAEFVLGVEPRSGGVADAVVRARRVGQGQGPPGCGRRRPAACRCWGARGSRSAAIFDVDGDGDLDIVTNEFNAAPMVLVSNLTEKTTRPLRRGEAHRHARRIATGSAPSSRSPPAGSTYTKVMDGNSGYLSHSLYPLYFGLGAAQAVDSIEVTWPSGKTQTVQAADQDQLADRGPRSSRRAGRVSRCRTRRRLRSRSDARSLHRPVADAR